MASAPVQNLSSESRVALTEHLAAEIPAKLKSLSSKDSLILGANGFNIDRIDPSFPTVVRSVKDAGKAVSLEVVKTRTKNRGTVRDLIKYLTILEPGYTCIPLSVPRSNDRRFIYRGLEAPRFLVGIVGAISLSQQRRPPEVLKDRNSSITIKPSPLR